MTAMASPASPAETRAFILERLVGETGEPDRIVAAARDLADRAAPAIAAALDGVLSFPVSVSVAGVTLARMSDARPPEGTSSALCVVPSQASPDAVVLVLDTAAITLFTVAMFGGDPELRAQAAERELSAVEISVADCIVGLVAEAVNGGGARSLTLRLPPPPPVAGAEMQKQPLRDGPAVRVEFLVSCQAGVGRIVMSMPQRLMLKPRGEGGVSNADAAHADSWSTRFSDEVVRSRVRLEASVPLPAMTLGEISRLRAGQVLELPRNAQAETRLSAGHKTLFVCEFGKLGQNYTVRIRKPFDPGEDLIDGIMGR